MALPPPAVWLLAAHRWATLPIRTAELLLRTAASQPVLAARATLAGVALAGTWGTAWLPLPRKPHPPRQKQAEPSGASDSKQATAPDPLATPLPRFHGCRGLEQVSGSLAAAVFDPVYGTRAYGLTQEGRLAVLSLAARQGRPEDSCRLRSASRPLQRVQGREGRQASLAGLPGYALVSSGGTLALLNVSDAMRAPPRLLLRQPLANLSRQLAALLPGAELLQQQQVVGGWQQRRALDRDATAAAAAGASGEAGNDLATLLATDRQGRVAVGLGDSGVVAIFSTDLPFGRAPAPGSSRTVGWIRGVLQLAAVAGAVGMAMWKARAMPGGGGDGNGGGFGRRRGRGAGELDKLQRLEALLRDPLLAREPKWGRRRRTAAAAAAAEEDEPEDSAGGQSSKLEPGTGGAAAAAARCLAQPASSATGGEAGGRGKAVHELAAAAAALERGRQRAQNWPDHSGVQEDDSELAPLGSRQNSGFGSDIDD